MTHSLSYYSKDVVRQTDDLLTSPTNMSIPDYYGSATYGGFDGNCVIGLDSLYFGGNTTNNYDRSVIFNAKSNPFIDVANLIQNDSSGNMEFFFANWKVVCLSTC